MSWWRLAVFTFQGSRQLSDSVKTKPAALVHLDKHSRMQSVGRLLFVGTFILGLVAFAMRSDPDDNPLAGPLLILACGFNWLAALMWMLGSIEQRLLEIRDGVYVDRLAGSTKAISGVAQVVERKAGLGKDPAQ